MTSADSAPATWFSTSAPESAEKSHSPTKASSVGAASPRVADPKLAPTTAVAARPIIPARAAQFLEISRRDRLRARDNIIVLQRGFRSIGAPTAHDVSANNHGSGRRVRSLKPVSGSGSGSRAEAQNNRGSGFGTARKGPHAGRAPAADQMLPRNAISWKQTRLLASLCG